MQGLRNEMLMSSGRSREACNGCAARRARSLPLGCLYDSQKNTCAKQRFRFGRVTRCDKPYGY